MGALPQLTFDDVLEAKLSVDQMLERMSRRGALRVRFGAERSESGDPYFSDQLRAALQHATAREMQLLLAGIRRKSVRAFASKNRRAVNLVPTYGVAFPLLFNPTAIVVMEYATPPEQMHIVVYARCSDGEGPGKMWRAGGAPHLGDRLLEIDGARTDVLPIFRILVPPLCRLQAQVYALSGAKYYSQW